MAVILTRPATLSALVLAANGAAALTSRPRPQVSLDSRDAGRSPAPIHFSCGDYLKYEEE
jgi:hypothetical protein